MVRIFCKKAVLEIILIYTLFLQEPVKLHHRLTVRKIFIIFTVIFLFLTFIINFFLFSPDFLKFSII